MCWRALTVMQGHGAPRSATRKWGIWWGIGNELDGWIGVLRTPSPTLVANAAPAMQR